MRTSLRATAALLTLVVGGCVVAPPTGPTVMALPAKDKSFEAFQADDAACRQFATQYIGGASPAAAANQSLFGSAAIGTVLGAAAGAAIGAAAGNPAAGAAIGAGSGLALGTVSGVGAAHASAGSLQYSYDMGYLQCMAAKGESVPQTLPYSASGYGAGYPYYAYPYPYYYPGWYGPSFFSLGFGFGHFHHFHRR